MARDLNDVKLMGRPTRDPEVRYGADGKAVVIFTLAVNRTSEITDFLNCVAFAGTAELIEKYVRKGTKIVVEGSLISDSYTKDDTRFYTTKVRVNQFYFCESKGNSSNAAVAAGGSAPDDAFMDLPDGLDEDLPFN